MADRRTFLDIAHECALQGQILAEIDGGGVGCFIATDRFLYIGKYPLGKAPIDLQAFPWQDLVQVHTKAGIMTISITYSFSRSVVDIIAKAAAGSVFAGAIGLAGAALAPKNEITVKWPIKYAEAVEQFVKVARSLAGKIPDTPIQQVRTASTSLVSDLEALEGLHSRGVLTDDEFTKAKKRLLEGASVD